MEMVRSDGDRRGLGTRRAVCFAEAPLLPAGAERRGRRAGATLHGPHPRHSHRHSHGQWRGRSRGAAHRRLSQLRGSPSARARADAEAMAEVMGPGAAGAEEEAVGATPWAWRVRRPKAPRAVRPERRWTQPARGLLWLGVGTALGPAPAAATAPALVPQKPPSGAASLPHGPRGSLWLTGRPATDLSPLMFCPGNIVSAPSWETEDKKNSNNNADNAKGSSKDNEDKGEERDADDTTLQSPAKLCTLDLNVSDEL